MTDLPVVEMVQPVEPLCSICDHRFSVAEWVDRHEAVDGPCHALCCLDERCREGCRG